MQALIAEARRKYHAGLLANGVLTIDVNGVPSNADRSSKLSIAIAKGIALRLLANEQDKALGQTVGAKFELLNMAQRGLSVAVRSVKLSKDHHTAIEEVRYVSHTSQT